MIGHSIFITPSSKTEWRIGDRICKECGEPELCLPFGMAVYSNGVFVGMVINKDGRVTNPGEFVHLRCVRETKEGRAG